MTHYIGLRDRIKTHMNLMDKVRRVANTANGSPMIDIVLPSIYFRIIFECKPVFLILRFQENAIRPQFYTVNTYDILKMNDGLLE